MLHWHLHFLTIWQKLKVTVSPLFTAPRYFKFFENFFSTTATLLWILPHYGVKKWNIILRWSTITQCSAWFVLVCLGLPWPTLLVNFCQPWSSLVNLVYSMSNQCDSMSIQCLFNVHWRCIQCLINVIQCLFNVFSMCIESIAI